MYSDCIYRYLIISERADCWKIIRVVCQFAYRSSSQRKMWSWQTRKTIANRLNSETIAPIKVKFVRFRGLNSRQQCEQYCLTCRRCVTLLMEMEDLSTLLYCREMFTLSHSCTLCRPFSVFTMFKHVHFMFNIYSVAVFVW